MSDPDRPTLPEGWSTPGTNANTRNVEPAGDRPLPARVPRYTIGDDDLQAMCVEHPEGAWVLATAYDALAAQLETTKKECDEARLALGDAAREINVAGPVVERIRVLRRELTEYGQKAEAERDALAQQLQQAQGDYYRAQFLVEAEKGRADKAEAELQQAQAERDEARRQVSEWEASDDDRRD